MGYLRSCARILPALLCLYGVGAWAQDRTLLLIGGGERPAEALRRFAEASNGQVLVVTWASSEPDVQFGRINRDFRAAGATEVIHAAAPQAIGTPPPDNMGRAWTRAGLRDFERQLDLALEKRMGIFFSGGNQAQLLSALTRREGKRIRAKLLKLYESGIPIGGTSAGTGFTPHVAIVGDSDHMRRPRMQRGLGILLPPEIVDQHFAQRGRMSRLQDAMDHAERPVGLGIDEDTALWIRNDEAYEVIGRNRVYIVHRDPTGRYFHDIKLVNGQKFDLRYTADGLLERGCFQRIFGP